ncbi:uncharacterized protein LOC133031949 [Cannabis sativa]|uniref:uncharacterized protein LOC133031949 n=1 Tax=Cannabis sativa TaxID=3483 RepID=UPI0029CA126A|nr:uncharacterized protein LOC133031949 [Cannabis sativa]
MRVPRCHVIAKWRRSNSPIRPVSTHVVLVSSPVVRHMAPWDWDNQTPPDPTVSFFITSDGCWDKDKLSTYFDEEVIHAILSVPISDSSLDDTLIWEPHPSGSLTVSSAYHLANSSNSLPTSSTSGPLLRWWKNLWNLKLPKKIKHFVWRAFHHTLPTALNLFHKKIVPTALCSSCSRCSETVSHALIECPRASTEWQVSRFKSFYMHNRCGDIQEFLLKGFHEFSRDDLRFFLGITWEIWNRRNISLFNKHKVSFSSADFQVSCLLQDYDDAQTLHGAPAVHLGSSSSSGTSSQIWPKPGYFKLNVDAALNNHMQKIGICATVSNSNGEVVAALSSSLNGTLTPLLAEAKALLIALRWCAAVRFSLDCVASDCLILVNRLKNRWKDNSSFSDLVQQILPCLSTFPNAALIHVSRNHNVPTHNLAKAGVRLESEGLWNGSIPEFM